MTTERWARTVRGRLGLGRLLPLGGPHDGAWITEEAARDALRRAAADVVGVRLDTLRIALADPEDTHDPVVPAPPSALPPGPLRVTADFAATTSGAVPEPPLPVVAARLRVALAGAAEWVGLVVAEVDLRVTDLLDEETSGSGVPGIGAPEPDASAVRVKQERKAGWTDADEERAAEAALSVPGVAGLTSALGGLGGRTVHFEERPTDAGTLPRRHVRVEIAVTADVRTVEAARAVRSAVGEALRDGPTVAVLVTGVEQPGV